jgi:hypothetical protein
MKWWEAEEDLVLGDYKYDLKYIISEFSTRKLLTYIEALIRVILPLT